MSATAGSSLARFRRGWGRLGRALEHPAVMPGIAVAGAVFVVTMVSFALRGDPLIGYDAHAYYQAAALDDPYRATINGGFDAVGGLYEYKYPPPLAQVLHPVRMLGISWPVFLGAWTALLLVSLAFMGRRWTLLLLLFPPVLGELWLGNLNILLGLAIVLGMRWPGVLGVHPADEDHPGHRPDLVRRRGGSGGTSPSPSSRPWSSSASATSWRRGCGPTSSRRRRRRSTRR